MGEKLTKTEGVISTNKPKKSASEIISLGDDVFPAASSSKYIGVLLDWNLNDQLLFKE